MTGLTAREATSYRTRETARQIVSHYAETLREIETGLRTLEPELRHEVVRRCERVVGSPMEQDDTSHPLAILALMAREAGAKRV